jgi:thiamine-phosphate pyrophosphorylase
VVPIARKGRRLIRCRLYLITPPRIELKSFAPVLEQTLAQGDVASLQLRLKDVSDEAIADAIRILKPIAQKKDVAFILNDRPDLAADFDCDGVHVGQEDAPYDEARRFMGPNKIVGVTCHNSRHLALEAAETGADYVAFGAFFPTATKQAKTAADIEVIEWWAEIMEIPCVAIGGITVANAAPLVAAGADFLAVSSGVWDHEAGPAAAVREFNDLFARTAR